MSDLRAALSRLTREQLEAAYIDLVRQLDKAGSKVSAGFVRLKPERPVLPPKERQGVEPL